MKFLMINFFFILNVKNFILIIGIKIIFYIKSRKTTDVQMHQRFGISLRITDAQFSAAGLSGAWSQIFEVTQGRLPNCTVHFFLKKSPHALLRPPISLCVVLFFAHPPFLALSYTGGH